MSLSSGNKLGPCEILSSIGPGGMGEVWETRNPSWDMLQKPMMAINSTVNVSGMERF